MTAEYGLATRDYTGIEGHISFYNSTMLLLLLLLLLLLDEDEDLDKFGQALDSGQDLSAVDTSSKTDSKSASDQVQWEFKWENATAAALYGPFGTQQMAEWKEQG